MRSGTEGLLEQSTTQIDLGNHGNNMRIQTLRQENDMQQWSEICI